MEVDDKIRLSDLHSVVQIYPKHDQTAEHPGFGFSGRWGV